MIFKFGWNLDVFAKKNSLSAGEKTTATTMEMVQQAAERDVNAFAERIKTAAIRSRGVFYHFDYESPKTECEIL